MAVGRMKGTAQKRLSGHGLYMLEIVSSTLSTEFSFFKKSSQVFGEAERSLDLKKEVWIEILNAFSALSPHVKLDLN